MTPKDCSKSELLGARQDGHRIGHEGSKDANDGAHLRRLEQTCQAGKILCPILQSGELVQIPE